jgi:hypothetical protein
MLYYKIVLIDVALTLVILIIMVCIVILITFPYQIFSPNQICLSKLLEKGKTGDLILFSSKTPELRFASLSPWSHVGMIIDNPKDPQNPLFIESDIPLKERGRRDLFSGVLDKNGVKLLYLKDKIEGYQGIMAFRELNFKNENKDHPKYRQFWNRTKDPVEFILWLKNKYSHLKYQNAASFWMQQFVKLRKLSPFGFVRFKRPKSWEEKIFCSELVFDIYKNLGICNRDLESRDIMPKHFASITLSKLIEDNWKLEKEHTIVRDS